MPVIENLGLPERQARFARLVVEGCKPAVAAEQAGYAPPYHPVAWKLLRLPHVLAAIHHEVQRELTADAPNSYRVLREIRDDVTAPVRTRADVSVKLLQLAGHVAPSAREQAAAKPLNEMTSEELLAYIDSNQQALERLEGELAHRVSAPSDAPLIDGTIAKPMDYLD